MSGIGRDHLLWHSAEVAVERGVHLAPFRPEREHAARNQAAKHQVHHPAPFLSVARRAWQRSRPCTKIPTGKVGVANQMHILSEHHRSEFLAVPQLLRTTMARGGSDFEPTVLIKTLSLSIKYLILSRELQFVLMRLPDGFLGYGVLVDRDLDHPAVLWSVMEKEDERLALTALVDGSRCAAFLYNELAINIAQTEIVAQSDNNKISHWINQANLAPEGHHCLSDSVSAKLDAFLKGAIHDDLHGLKAIRVFEWTEIHSSYITNRLKVSNVSAFSREEGDQQEEVVLWLIDELIPEGAIKNPTVHHETKSRELADLLLSYGFGSFLFESKTLSVLSRATLPTREKLTTALVGHITKAERQLRGGIRSLKRNCRITNEEGEELEVDRAAPMHAIILVPDLSLLFDAKQFGGKFLRKFYEKTGCSLQILDLTELLRMVQAAAILERRGKVVTRMMCFDAHLFERFKCAINQETPDFGFLLRMAGD